MSWVTVGIVAAVAGAGLAELGPAGSWLPAVRRHVCPALAGAGRPDHVALTFDDGPHPVATPRLLDLLRELDVRATFFLLADRVPGREAVLRRMRAEGHEIGVHGLHHDRPWRCWRAHRDLSSAVDVLTAATGRRPAWYRPPYGILTASRWRAARRLGLRPTLWTAWGRDWTAAATPATVLAALGDDLAGGTVLLHDSDVAAAPGCWRAGLGALPDLVAGCRRQGLRVGPLAEHAGTAPVRPSAPAGRPAAG